MIEIPYKDLILSASKATGISPEYIAGVIKIESGFQPMAEKAEPQINDTSYGLMQILLGTGRMIVPNISVEQLLTPEININVGSKYLAQLYAKYNSIDDMISSYNQGSPRKDASGNYLNQVYVNNVKWWASIFKYLLPYGDYVVPVALTIVGLVTVIWESRNAKR